MNHFFTEFQRASPKLKQALNIQTFISKSSLGSNNKHTYSVKCHLEPVEHPATLRNKSQVIYYMTEANIRALYNVKNTVPKAVIKKSHVHDTHLKT